MKIKIIVYSKTGNTNSVAEKLKEKLEKAGHGVGLDRLKPVGEIKPGSPDVRFEELPDLNGYDAFVFCSPVEAFSLPAVMKSYLNRIAPLNGKKVSFIVTQAFKYPWLGGNNTVRTMKKFCESKGALICGSMIVNWSSERRGQQITSGVDKLCSAFILLPH